VSGQIRRADSGEPLPGATVILLKPADFHWSAEEFEWQTVAQMEAAAYPYPHFKARTGADGRYELTLVPAGAYILCVAHEEFPGAWRGEVEVQEGKTTEGIDLALGPPWIFITGRLHQPDGTPVARTLITLIVASQSDPARSNRPVCCGTDAEGQLSFRLKEPGRYELTFRALDYHPAHLEVTLEAGEPGPTLDIELQPRRFGALAGTVFRPDGETPAAGVSVAPFTRAGPWPGAQIELKTDWAAITGADGTYRMERVEEGTYYVYATPRGFWKTEPASDPALQGAVAGWSGPVEVTGGSEVSDLKVTLREGGSVAGTVRDGEEGHPIANARVELQPLLPVRFGEERRLEVALTDGEGHYRIDGVPPQTYKAVVTAAGFKTSQRSPLRVQAGQVIQDADFTLAKARTGILLGRLFLPDGTTPADQTEVRLRGPADYRTATEEDGTFRLEKVDIGLYTLTASRPGYARTFQEKVAIGEGKTTRVDLSLKRGGTVCGHVYGPEGQPPEGEVYVVLGRNTERIQYFWPNTIPAQERFYTTSPQPDGFYALEHIPPGTYHLFVFADELIRAIRRDLEVQEGASQEGLDLHILPAQGTLTGQVIRADNGAPVVGAFVTPYHDFLAPGAFHAQTSDDGRYVLSGLLPGTYFVACQARNLAQVTVTVKLTGQAPNAEAHFRLPVGGTLTGRVIQADGQTPIAQAYIGTMPQDRIDLDPPPPGLSGVSTVTAADGTYRLENLSPGTYKLYVSAKGFQDQTKAGVVVKADMTSSDINITLTEGTRTDRHAEPR